MKVTPKFAAAAPSRAMASGQIDWVCVTITSSMIVPLDQRDGRRHHGGEQRTAQGEDEVPAITPAVDRQPPEPPVFLRNQRPRERNLPIPGPAASQRSFASLMVSLANNKRPAPEIPPVISRSAGPATACCERAQITQCAGRVAGECHWGWLVSRPCGCCTRPIGTSAARCTGPTSARPRPRYLDHLVERCPVGEDQRRARRRRRLRPRDPAGGRRGAVRRRAGPAAGRGRARRRDQRQPRFGAAGSASAARWSTRPGCTCAPGLGRWPSRCMLADRARPGRGLRRALPRAGRGPGRTAARARERRSRGQLPAPRPRGRARRARSNASAPTWPRGAASARWHGARLGRGGRGERFGAGHLRRRGRPRPGHAVRRLQLRGPRAPARPADPGHALRYSGSPLPYSFSEARHAKGCGWSSWTPAGPSGVERVPAPSFRAPERSARHARRPADVRRVRAIRGRLPVRGPDRHRRPEGAMEKLRARFPHMLVLAFEPEGAAADPAATGRGSPAATT